MYNTKQRIEALEEKVKVLEETLDTLKKMQLSKQRENSTQDKTKSLKTSGLVNPMPDKADLDFSNEEESLNNVQKSKRAVDMQIEAALKNVGTFSEDFPDDSRYFNYEVESGKFLYIRPHRETSDPKLAKFVGKGIRITAYNGFEANRVIIPNEINGQPVISIGEKAFMNTTISEVILPKSIGAILDSAFRGCKNLKHIDLPNTVEYLGEQCFSESGLTEFNCPNSLTTIPWFCFADCNDLKEVNLGNQVRQLGHDAFQKCSKLNNISLPENLKEIGSDCFAETAITTMIFPSGVEKVYKNAFSDRDIRVKKCVTCVFLGKDTHLDDNLESYDSFYNVSLIYCLPGSKMQQIAREISIAMKPLSEFISAAK